MSILIEEAFEENPFWQEARPAYGHAKLRDSVQTEFRPALLDALMEYGAHYNVSHRNICFAWKKKRTVKGVRATYINIFFYYSPDINMIIKESDRSGFDPKVKAWSIFADDFQNTIDKLSGHFRVIVDVDSGREYLSESTATHPLKSLRAFDLLLGMTQVNRDTVEAIFQEERPNDKFFFERLAVFDGNIFIPFPSNGSFNTNYPFLLFRNGVEGDSRERYISYSTVGECAESVIYGHVNGDISRLIAIFRETYHEFGCVDVIIEGECHDDRGYSAERNLSRLGAFKEALASVAAVIPDADIVLLPVSYVALARPITLAQSRDVFAYASMRPSFLLRVAKGLGLPSATRPVVVSDWYAEEVACGTHSTEEQVDLLLHELAHYVAPAAKDDAAPYYDYDDNHGVFFHIAYALLVKHVTGINDGRVRASWLSYSPQWHQDVVELDRVIGEIETATEQWVLDPIMKFNELAAATWFVRGDVVLGGPIR